MGIEPTLLAWEAKVLPLNYTRLVWALLYAFFYLNQRPIAAKWSDHRAFAQALSKALCFYPPPPVPDSASPPP